jgi:O-antigen/teichoic acid export membrane protein
MALKHNIIANYIGQFYLIIIGIVMIPFYLEYLGDEAYGLVGFFALVQGWMLLLDMGLSPTIAREVSKVRATNQKKDLEAFKYLFHSIEFLFLIITSIITFSLLFLSDWITYHWLNIEHLNMEDVSYSISLIGIMVGLRFLATLYKSGIIASEEQVWYNKANILLSTLKFVGALIVLKYISSDFKVYFEYQLIIFTLEFIVFFLKFYKIMDIGRFQIYFSFNTIRPVLKYAFSIAYTGAVWILISQLDKLLLSGILSLKEYGYFALVATVANAIIQIYEPVIRAILPRMTALYTQNKPKELFELYQNATQWIAIIVFSVGAIVSIYSYELLYSWTGNIEASQWGEKILFWYTIGNSLLALASLQTYLQIAYGKLKMNVRYYTVVLFLFPPVVYWVANTYGALGVAKLWFGFVLLSFLVWVPIVHHFFVPGKHIQWIKRSILPIFLSTISYLIVLKYLDFNLTQDRLFLFLTLLLIGAFLLILNYLISRLFKVKS